MVEEVSEPGTVDTVAPRLGPCGAGRACLEAESEVVAVSSHHPMSVYLHTHDFSLRSAWRFLFRFPPPSFAGVSATNTMRRPSPPAPRSSLPFHRITSSAWRSTDCGIVRPRVLAVLRLIASSNFVGCSTGRSAGLAPLRILSTNTATMR